MSAGALTIELTDTGFLAAGVASAIIGGNTEGTVTYRTWFDPGNGAFAKTTLLTAAGPFSFGAFDGSATGVVGPATPYSLTLETVIEHPLAGSTGFDAELTIAPCTGKIGDFVWEDLNGNGCQDADEPGIAGVQVDLYSGCAPDTNFLRSTVTDANGNYIFDGLCAGAYTVSFHTPAGYSHTLANQSCAIDGKPADETDSDCDCGDGNPCAVCVILPSDDSQNLTIDCGYIPNNPCLELVKTPDNETAASGAQMGYTYMVTNCGSTTFTNIAIVDDAGTPEFTGDDVTVGIVPLLGPGQAASFHGYVYLPIPLCAPAGGSNADAGLLLTEVLPSGDIKVTLRQSRKLNDNVYGTNAPADGWSSHKFGDLTGSDKAEFRFTDGTGKVVLDFYLDYLSASTLFPSGYGSLGPNGGDGSMITGSKTNVLSWTTTLADNLNSGLNGGFPSPYLINSPTPEPSFPNWDYVNGYTVVVSKQAFGANGFGGVTIPYIHNSPAKTGNNQVSPTPCGGCITNIATAGVIVDGSFVPLTTDDAIVCTGGSTAPVCLITEGTLKVDKNTFQLPIKNNGSADIFLTELDLIWPQGINGNLKKITLNGDVWIGLAGSPATISSGFTTDPNKRKIAKGQTKTLVLTFEKNASKTLGDYSGTVKFGTDTSCAIVLPPPAPLASFTCDSHLDEIQMKWTGSATINVVAHYGNATAAIIKNVNNVAPGDVVIVSGYAGSPNDVIWEIFDSATGIKLGVSDFHLSCSDVDMNGADDCGKSEGDGKGLAGTWITAWQLVGMTTKNGSKLVCP